MIEGLFSRYEFDETEEFAATILTDLQDKHVQNEIAIAYAKKLQLKLEPDDLATFHLEHKYWEGFTEALMTLRIMSNEARERFMAGLTDQPNTQKD